jgi:hypothetical protein
MQHNFRDVISYIFYSEQDCHPFPIWNLVTSYEIYVNVLKEVNLNFMLLYLRYYIIVLRLIRYVLRKMLSFRFLQEY